jgi:hypothetical protein
MIVALLTASVAWLVNVEPLGPGNAIFAIRDP